MRRGRKGVGFEGSSLGPGFSIQGFAVYQDPPRTPLTEPSWSVIVGIWGMIEGGWGV